MTVAVEREKPKEVLQEFKYTRAFDAPGPISKELLGDKGTGLAEMTRLRLPVPPGFTLTTEAWRAFDEKGELPEVIWNEIKAQITNLEEKTGRKFGDKKNPLILAVRSGAEWSMPGLLVTLLNIGINRETIKGLSARVGEVCTHDSYDLLQESFQKTIGKELPEDPEQQLRTAVKAVLNSWNNPRAIDFRRFANIPDGTGTAVNIQEMIFSNILDGQSGTGVFFTRDPLSGEGGIHGHYVPGGQGPEVVTPKQRPQEIPPRLMAEMWWWGQELEEHFGYPQDVEVTVEQGTPYLLQVREAELDPLAAIIAAVDMAEDGVITLEEARARIEPHLSFFSRNTFDPKSLEKARQQGRLLAQGRPASAGDVVGRPVFDLREAEILQNEGESAILFCPFLDLDTVRAIPFQGLVTTQGSSSSHPAILMRKMGIPAVVGADLELDPEKGLITGKGQTIKENLVSVSGNSGEIFTGKIKTKKPEMPPWLSEYLEEIEEEILARSSWNQFLSSEVMKINLETQVKEIAPRVNQWRSRKAQNAVILNTLIPEGYFIPSLVIKASKENTIQIRTALRHVVEAGYENAPRTCHFPDFPESPYFVGPNSLEEIEPFLSEVLTEWRKTPTLEAVIVSHEPPGKLDRSLSHEHFSFTISCDDHRIVVEAILGTPLVRAMKWVPSEDLIQITAELDERNPSRLGEIKINLGKTYQGNPYGERVAEIIKEKVFHQWWRPPFSLPALMAVLEENFGFSVLEVQGRMENEEKLAWVLAYDAKGRVEAEMSKSL